MKQAKVFLNNMLTGILTEDDSGYEFRYDSDYLKSDVSGVDTVLDEFAQHNDDEWFTIQGVKVTKPTSPGIYIRNGKKIIIK